LEASRIKKLRIEALKVTDSFYQQASFFKELFKKFQKLKDDNQVDQLEETIQHSSNVMELIQNTALSIMVLKKYPFKITMIMAKVYKRNSMLFQKNK